MRTDLYQLLGHLDLNEDEYAPPTLVCDSECQQPSVSDGPKGDEKFTLAWLKEYFFHILVTKTILIPQTIPSPPPWIL